MYGTYLSLSTSVSTSCLEAVAQPQPFADAVTRLAKARGWSIERLSYETYDPDERGTSPALFRKALAGKRALTPHLMEATARALDVDPDTFTEYRLARVRRLFDPHKPKDGGVGVEVAIANLTELEVIYPRLGDVDRLVEGLDEDKEHAAAIHAEFEAARARALEAQENTAGENSPPPGEEAPTAPRRRARRRPPEAS